MRPSAHDSVALNDICVGRTGTFKILGQQRGISLLLLDMTIIGQHYEVGCGVLDGQQEKKNNGMPMERRKSY